MAVKIGSSVYTRETSANEMENYAFARAHATLQLNEFRFSIRVIHYHELWRSHCEHFVERRLSNCSEMLIYYSSSFHSLLSW